MNAHTLYNVIVVIKIFDFFHPGTFDIFRAHMIFSREKINFRKTYDFFQCGEGLIKFGDK